MEKILRSTTGLGPSVPEIPAAYLCHLDAGDLPLRRDRLAAFLGRPPTRGELVPSPDQWKSVEIICLVIQRLARVPGTRHSPFDNYPHGR